jgi:small subunit ribosomal protein S2
LPTPVSMKQLLEAGVHFGHQTRRWDPRMREFIFTERNGIHIIDLQQTVGRLQDAIDFVRDLSARGETILFVGTKKQAQETVEQEAARCEMPYVNNRWLGGTLTNFRTIQSRIDHLVRLEDQRERGEFARLGKREVLAIEKEIERLNRHFGGIKEMTRLPGAMFVIDTVKEHIAVTEAKKVDIPIVSLVDTNCNPEVIDYPIPSNDDAIRAIKLIMGKIADAVVEGKEAQEYGGVAASADEFDEDLGATGTFSASPDDEPEVEPDPDAEPEAGATPEAEASPVAEPVPAQAE